MSELSIQLDGSGAVAGLEAKLRCHCSSAFAVCTSSATTGLLGLALALDLRDAEFITTPFTWGGAIGPWMLAGNRPRFADVDPETLCIDPDHVRRAITSKTRAILAVDFLGNPCDTKELRRVANEHGLWYVADAAESMGAEIDGEAASSSAHATVVSFGSGKTIDAGEGGAVVTNDRSLYEKLIWHTQHPARQLRDLGPGFENQFGLNGRIHPSGAKLALAGWDLSIRRLRRRQAACVELSAAIRKSGIALPHVSEGARWKSAFFRLAASWKGPVRKGDLQAWLRESGFDILIDDSPIEIVYRQAAFIAQWARFARKVRCPIAESVSRRMFCVRRRVS